MQTYSGVYQITPENGSAFFLRTDYLRTVTESDLFAGASLSDEETSDVLNAALVYSAEAAAMSYLARSEHCREGLRQKLLKKGIDRNAFETALDRLESEGILDDLRYSGAWLRTRAINHAEGRIRLFSELASRGISSRVAKKALDEFFDDNDETEICRRALRKTLVTVSPDQTDKIRMSLCRKGFSMKTIQAVLEDFGDNG